MGWVLSPNDVATRAVVQIGTGPRDEG
jgi:hypothetical protein